jgi:hypothetical protein
VNMLYIFESRTSVFGYLLFIMLMGGLSFGIGAIADAWSLPGLMTVAVFTMVNLLLGHCFFRFVLFRRKQI